MKKLIETGSYITLAGTFIMSLFIAFWLIYPYKPLVVNGNPKVPEVVKSGGVTTFEMDYCKNTDLPVTVRRRFIDGLIYTIPEISTDHNKAGCQVQTILLDVPDKLPEGEYFFSTDFVYRVNPIREVTVTVESNSFRVIK